MSACSSWRQGDTSCLFTDAAEYSTIDGSLTSIHSKVFSLPSSSSAFAIRGTWSDEIVDQLIVGLGRAASFDELLATAGGYVFYTHRAACAVATDAFGDNPDFEITIIGWSGFRQRGEVWTLATWSQKTDDEGAWADYIPFVAADVTTGIIRPGLGEAEDFLEILAPLCVGRRLESVEDVEAIAVEAVALAILESQRQLQLCSDREERGYRGCSVGGFAELTTVSAEGISRKILKYWPDEIGKVMNA